VSSERGWCGVFGLIFLLFRLAWLCLVACIWLCWALIALTVSLVASLTGNRRVARQWQRSLYWRHLRL